MTVLMSSYAVERLTKNRDAAMVATFCGGTPLSSHPRMTEWRCWIICWDAISGKTGQAGFPGSLSGSFVVSGELLNAGQVAIKVLIKPRINNGFVMFIPRMLMNVIQ
jgi:hypothetical protein